MANKSISQLNAGGAVAGTDLFVDVQAVGVGPVKVTATQMATFFWYNPTLVSPDIGAATGTSLTLGGATIGSNRLAISGTTLLGGATTISSGGLTVGVAGTTGGTIALKGSTAGTLTLQVPATVTDYSITLPAAVAAGNGYILTSTSAGVTSWTNPTSLGIDLDVGTTPITNGTSTRVLYNNAGILGEYAVTGSGDVVLNNSPTFTDDITLGTQGTAGTQGALVLANTANGSFSTTVKSSNSATAAWTLTLPTTAGAGTGYVLSTDGTGVTSWVQAGSISTGFLQGSVIFAGAGGVLAQNNAKLFWDDTNYRLGINDATPSVTLDIAATDAIRIPVGNGTTERPAGVTGYIRFNTDTGKFEGYGASSWGNIGGGAAITDETTNATRYPLFANATTGDLTSVFVSSTKYTFNPSTGNLLSTSVGSNNGILINSTTVSADYTVPSGYNGLSGGPVTVNSGITVTVSSGSVWTVV